jgi:dipeptidyl aminopeptidase/acylaminoacyl peptidase
MKYVQTLRGRAGLLLALIIAAPAMAAPMAIPAAAPGPLRDITTRDLIGVRDVDTLSLSPDGSRYAILVRQAIPERNAYQTGWFVGATAGGAPTYVGDGGEARLRESPIGRPVGAIIGSPGRWSPDGRSLAWFARADGEIQLWVSTDGGAARRLTDSPADIRDFAWSDDGARLLFTVGPSRAEVAAREQADQFNGVLLEDFQFFSEIVFQSRPERPLAAEQALWTIAAEGSGARVASEAERAMFERARSRNYSWGRSQPQGLTTRELFGAAAPPIAAANGSLAWLARADPSEDGQIPNLRITASRRPDGSRPIACAVEQCRGQIFSKIWWSADSREVVFWRKEDVNLVENSFYAWSPDSGRLRRIYHNDGDEFRECELAGTRLICAREAVDRPVHIVAIDTRSGALSVLAELNPEFAHLRLGRVERFQWDAPRDVHQIGYPSRMFGYVIYPPDFDASRRYPVFIAPYGAPGFRRGDVGNEHPLFVYAANGFVVISAQFPVAVASFARANGVDMRRLYSPELGFPHLSMYAGSTFNALDAVAARGFVDPARVGIGGISHGSFVPTFMVQTQDRIAAMSIAGPSWSQHEYYASTANGRRLNNVVEGWPESRDFWSRIDLADHVEEVEAPILVNYADREFIADWRLPRSMENGGRAFEAFIHPNETHIKWQPGHLFAIYNRNLDWFRFWLQDIEDPDPAKAGQYARWRALRAIQCRNPRSLRDYCGMPGARDAPAVSAAN